MKNNIDVHNIGLNGNNSLFAFKKDTEHWKLYNYSEIKNEMLIWVHQCSFMYHLSSLWYHWGSLEFIWVHWGFIWVQLGKKTQHNN